MPSFDIVVQTDLQEVENAVNQARKEIAQRYDFRGSKSRIDWDKGGGELTLVGDLRLPQGAGPFPAVVFVHGDGSNNRTSGVTYPPIMDRMLRAGYATFAWDKPGTGESTGEIDRSRLQHQRAQIVLDAIEVLHRRPDIDPDWIGMWGISQAGYVMPRVLERGGDVAFMIAVSCPGVPGVEQGAYLLTAQAVCAGLPDDDRAEVERLFAARLPLYRSVCDLALDTFSANVPACLQSITASMGRTGG